MEKSDSNNNNNMLRNNPSLNQESSSMMQFIAQPLQASNPLAIEPIPFRPSQQPQSSLAQNSLLPLASQPAATLLEANNTVSNQNRLQQQQQLLLLLQQQRIPEPEPIASQPLQQQLIPEPEPIANQQHQPARVPIPSVLIQQEQQQLLSQQQLSNPTLRGDRRRLLSERDKFLLFIKILLKFLAQSEETQNLRQRAKLIVAECTRRNRMGDLNYSPLKQAVERRLQGALGMEQWNRAEVVFDVYCQRNGFVVSDTPRLASV